MAFCKALFSFKTNLPHPADGVNDALKTVLSLALITPHRLK